ncbi:MAG: hypothetical protein WC565_04305 [Parcubacteria group bacterium]|jgi:hypothetical protein
MINRFKFHHEDEGRTIHCVVVEIPRKGARVPCVSAGGKFYRVPAELLKHVPAGSPITDPKAAELLERGFTHLSNKRERAQLARDRRAELDRQLGELLGADLMRDMEALTRALA